jgi:hypothetical protein
MTYPHPMRLRGPWNWATLAPAETKTGTVNVPADWGEILNHEFAGPVRFSRHFQAPSQLEPHERLFVVVQGIDAAGTVRVNETELGQITGGYPASAAFDITPLLAPRNRLEIDVTVPPGTPRYGREGKAGGIVREIRLEVRTEAYLEISGVWAEADPQIVVGRFVPRGIGSDQRGLELHVRAGQAYGHWPVAIDQPGGFTLRADGLQRWNRARGAATPVEVVLMRGDRRLWEKTFYTGLPGEDTWPPQNVRPLPEIEWCAWLRTWPRPSLAPPESENDTFLVREILPDEAYAAFDEAGIAIVQAVESGPWTAGWEEHWWQLEFIRNVLPLAHHPCIAGWVRPRQASETEIPPLFGRPWWSPQE